MGGPDPCMGPNPGNTPLDPSGLCAPAGSSRAAFVLPSEGVQPNVGVLRAEGRSDCSGAAACPPARSSSSGTRPPHALPPDTRPCRGAGHPPVGVMAMSGGALDY